MRKSLKIIHLMVLVLFYVFLSFSSLCADTLTGTQKGSLSTSYSPTIGAPTNTKTQTFAFTNTPTNTVTNTPTNTPTNTVTYTPTYTPTSQAFVAIGDSNIAGIGANPITNGFAYLTGKQLAIWFPGTKFINLGYSGYSSEGFVNGKPPLIKTALSGIAEYDYGQMTRAAIYLGGLNISHSGCTACAYGLTYAQGVSISYLYKNQMQTILTDVLAINPSCKIVVCSLLDPSNKGLGPKFDFIPSNPNLVPVFNQRLQEIVAANAVTANVAYCDFYNSMMGHLSWYTPKSFGDDAYHPTNEGHDLLAIVLEAVFANMDKNSVGNLK